MELIQKIFIFTILPLGSLVVLSYILGIGDNADILWGGVTEKLRKPYTLSMLLSATSYMIFTSYIFFNLLKNQHSLPFNIPTYWIVIIYAVMLIASAAWIPLVNRMVSNPTNITWILIRTSLALVAFASLAILILIFKTPDNTLHYKISLIGITIYLIHTGILDAIIWPYLWKK